MTRLGRAILLVIAGLAACGPGKSATQPAPFPTATGDTPAVEPAPSADPPAPAMTQTAKPQDLTFPNEPFRAEQPKPGDPRKFNLPKMKPFSLKNGIKVYLVEQHTLPIVSAQLVFDGGGMTDPDGKEGLASVCMSMLTEGTQRLDKIAYSEALADIASSINSFAGDDTQGIAMNTLSKHFDTTFALFVETLRTPGMRAEDLDRMIKRRQEGIKQAKASPASVAGRVSSPVLYGAAHPFGAVTTETSLGAIKLEDCKAYVAKWLKPKGARLFVVGDLTEAQIKKAFGAEALAGWTGKGPAMPKLPSPKTMKGKVFFVDIPGAEQSQVSLMHFGPKRGAPDYFPTMIMSSLLGGGFTSRINMNLRENKGYSYGARGGFSYNRHYGWFTAGAPVKTATTYQSLLELLKEVGDLHAGKKPPVADEMDREKAGATLGLPGRFATASASLDQFRGLVYFGLPLDYYASYVDKVGAVKAQQVTTAAKKHLKPAQAAIVVVGDAKAPMIVRNGDKDEPFKKDGKDVTLRDALVDLIASGQLGKGAQLVELDADGKPKK